MGQQENTETQNGSGLYVLPGWARAVVTIVFQQGLSAAIALALLWVIAERLLASVDRIHEDLRAHATVTATTSQSFAAFAAAQSIETRELLAVMRQLCVNTSESDQQRRECVR